MTTVAGLMNIGSTVAARLKEIGITSRADLEKVGSAKAYRWLSESTSNKKLPVCYYLYSLEGAIQNRHWNDFTESEKAKLRKEAGI